MPNRVIAIDWSGDDTGKGQRETIWMADWRQGSITLTAGRTRRETIDAVIAAAREDSSLVAGFDFSFAYPAWFAQENNCASAAELWALVARDGEAWLRDCQAPFWGRPGKRRPEHHYKEPWLGYRKTERETKQHTGRLPSSTFQIGGAGAVGTGSMRGMPHLLDLQAAGFSVWPFDAPRLPLVVEIYPRLFTKRTRVSRAEELAEHLQQPAFAAVPPQAHTAARNSPDAFDALCAMVGMVEQASGFDRLPQATDADELLEGAIWMPRQM